jgi:hypothetical protein
VSGNHNGENWAGFGRFGRFGEFGAGAPNTNGTAAPKQKRECGRAPFSQLKNHSHPVGVMAIVAGRHNPISPKFQAHSTTLRAERMSPHGS